MALGWVAVVGLAGCGPSGEMGPGQGMGPAEIEAARAMAAEGTMADPANGVGGDARSATASTKMIRDARPAVGGQWAAPFDMSVIAIHMALQPDRRVLYYGSDIAGVQTAARQYGVWDPASGDVMTLDNPTGTDIFCSSQTLLGDGRTLIVGGDQPDAGNTANRESTLFSAATNTLTRGPQMNRLRWYSSTTMLMSGEVYIQGGSGGTDRPEIRQADGSFRLLSGANTSPLSFEFPRNWIAPDGRLFGIDTGGQMYHVNTSGAGAVTLGARLPAAQRPGSTGNAMYRPGLIFTLAQSSPSATLIDIRGAAPVVTQTEAGSAIRVDSVATVLADGRVMASGGANGRNALASAALSADVWNPVTGEWTVGPNQRNARLYHGTALLLHDGRVLVAGGGAPGPLTNRNGEIFTPAYLFDSTGQLAVRPTIEQAPTVVQPARSFAVRTAGRPVSRVTMVRFGSVSHSWNADQRFLDLPWRATDGTGRQVAVQLPGRATDTPPGWYMLFVFDDAGVPSVASTVRVLPPEDPQAATAPQVSTIADRDWAAGPVSLQPIGTSPVGRPIVWSASGLPPGLAIDAATGAVTGTPTRAGTYFTTLAADDGTRTGSSSFVWTVSPSEARIVWPVSSGPALAGGAIPFTADVQGRGLTYTWNFGDGTPTTARSTTPNISHSFAQPGVYTVTFTVYDAQNRPTTGSFVQTIHRAVSGPAPVRTAQIALSGSGETQKLWVVNPDAESVTVFDTVRGSRLAEIRTGRHPATVTVDADGRAWVANSDAATVSVIDGTSLSVVRTLEMPYGSKPYGVLADPTGRTVWITLEATGQLLKYDARSFARTGAVTIGQNVRHLAVSGNGALVYATRFITPSITGESTAKPSATAGGGEVIRVEAGTLRVAGTTLLRQSTRVDAENQGRGLPNYLGAMAISPDGTQAFVPSKQDNILRGTLRDGRALDFQNTVRAVSSRIVMGTHAEDLAARIDHDNASVASAAAFDPLGSFLFVALETSREVAVIDAHRRQEWMRLDVGRAPQSVVVSPDGERLYVHDFMDRTIHAFDLRPLRNEGRLEVPLLAVVSTVSREPLTPQVLRGKQLFYDARDPRLARDRYMSCASCHADGGHDGRTWDFTSLGEGLRNTPMLRGRAGMAQGRVHWSGNFDEIQDFENPIRSFAGGTGLMTDAQFGQGTRSQPLGDRKAGVSADLDALAAYVTSLDRSDRSPLRQPDGTLSAAARAGEALFVARGCMDCHGGPGFTRSAEVGLQDVGTIRQPTSGKRLGGPLQGIDPPTLRDVWASGPYLHDGSAATVEAAIRAHRGVTMTATEFGQLARYVSEIGDGAAPGTPPASQGLRGEYFAGTTPGAGAPLAVRTEAVAFDWGTAAPAPGVPADRFSVRWSGSFRAPSTGAYRFRLVSDAGVRMWANGAQVANNWVAHPVTVDDLGSVDLPAGFVYEVVLEYYEDTGPATMRLEWIPPGQTAFVPIPAAMLRPPGVAF